MKYLLINLKSSRLKLSIKTIVITSILNVHTMTESSYWGKMMIGVWSWIKDSFDGRLIHSKSVHYGFDLIYSYYQIILQWFTLFPKRNFNFWIFYDDRGSGSVTQISQTSTPPQKKGNFRKGAFLLEKSVQLLITLYTIIHLGHCWLKQCLGHNIV